MEARKLQVKFFVESPDDFELEPFLPILHGWIRDKALDDLMIDVADYSHVPNGPGLLLVGHASDYYLDLTNGRPGLLYGRKRDAPEGAKECVLDAFRRALTACKKLEEDGNVRFRSDEMLFRVNDRLLGPNTDETWQAVEPVLDGALKELYGDTPFRMERGGEARELLSVKVTADGAPRVGELLSRLE